MNVTISKAVERSLGKMSPEERELFVNSTLLVALANKEIMQERKTPQHQDILIEAKKKALLNNQTHSENVDKLEVLLSQTQS